VKIPEKARKQNEKNPLYIIPLILVLSVGNFRRYKKYTRLTRIKKEGKKFSTRENTLLDLEFDFI
jgi:hypothetical protein